MSWKVILFWILQSSMFCFFPLVGWTLSFPLVYVTEGPVLSISALWVSMCGFLSSSIISPPFFFKFRYGQWMALCWFSPFPILLLYVRKNDIVWVYIFCLCFYLLCILHGAFFSWNFVIPFVLCSFTLSAFWFSSLSLLPFYFASAQPLCWCSRMSRVYQWH